MSARKNCTSKNITVFDTVGSYFVDIFYNHLYLCARSDVKKSEESLSTTDVYRKNVLSFMEGIAAIKNYKTVVNKLHIFYQRNSFYMSLSDFQDKFLTQFIPLEYYEDFSEAHKDNAFFNIITKSVKEFGVKIIQYHLKNIIEDHLNRENVKILQDTLVDIFCIQRDLYYSQFAKAITNASDTEMASYQELVRLLQTRLQTEKSNYNKLLKDYDLALRLIKKLKEDKEKINVYNIPSTNSTTTSINSSDITRTPVSNNSFAFNLKSTTVAPAVPSTPVPSAIVPSISVSAFD
mgnify:FL=1